MFYCHTQAAEQGHIEAQYTVATLALEGDATAQSSSADADAAKWYDCNIYMYCTLLW
jgi:TPR repeat protein